MTTYPAKPTGPGAFRLMTNAPPDIPAGETVWITIERARSPASHKQQFAWLADAWGNLPEADRDMPWAETPETLRKHALIATGFCHSMVIDCGTNAAAMRVKAGMLPALMVAHGYAVGRVTGPVLTVWTPESQSLKAMGRERFQASKTAIMEWVAARIGVDPERLGAR